MIILDTCAFLWLNVDPGRLSAKARRAVAVGPLAMVAISAWEIAIKVESGKLLLPGTMSPAEFVTMAMAHSDIHELSLDVATLCAAAALPRIHRDPCDRMIIAAAMRHEAPIVTADPLIGQYPGTKVIW